MEGATFYGVIVKPGKKVPYSPNSDQENKLHLSQATLGASSLSGERVVLKCRRRDEGNEDIYLCSLISGTNESCSLDLVFDEYVEFSVVGDTEVHLTGYHLAFDKSDSEDFDDDEAYKTHRRMIRGPGFDNSEDDSDSDSSYSSLYDDSDDEFDIRQHVMNLSSPDGDVDDDEEDDNDDSSYFSSGSDMDDADLEEEEDGSDRIQRYQRALEDKLQRYQSAIDKIEERKERINMVSEKAQSRMDYLQQRKKVLFAQVEANKKAQAPDYIIEEITEESKEKANKSSPAKTRSRANGKTGAELSPKKGKTSAGKTDTGKRSAAAPSEKEPPRKKDRATKASDKEDGSSKSKGKDTKASTSAKKEKGKVLATPEKEDKEKGTKKSGAEDKNSNIQRFPSGLEIINLAMGEGNGKLAKNGKRAFVTYVGRLKRGGLVFDSSEEPFAFRLGIGEVIKGWDLGVKGMRVGDKRRLNIPPELAYGNKRCGPIPKNSWLVFDIELVDVK